MSVNYFATSLIKSCATMASRIIENVANELLLGCNTKALFIVLF